MVNIVSTAKLKPYTKEKHNNIRNGVKLMLIAGITGQEGIIETANLVNSLLSSRGKKVSIIDSKNLMEMSSQLINNYINELSKNNVDILILKISLFDIEKDVFENIHFDMMLYTNKSDTFKEANTTGYNKAMKKSFTLLNEKGTAIINIDDKDLMQFSENEKYYIITYGFNSNAVITTSSIGDILFEDNFLCYLQRTISTRNGIVIEPQEYRIKIESNNLSTYDILAAASFAIINDIDLNSINLRAN